MAQRIIHTLENDIALLQEALESVQSPLTRATLAGVIETLTTMMRDDALDVRMAAYPPAPDERLETPGQMMCEDQADWF